MKLFQTQLLLLSFDHWTVPFAIKVLANSLRPPLVSILTASSLKKEKKTPKFQILIFFYQLHATGAKNAKK